MAANSNQPKLHAQKLYQGKFFITINSSSNDLSDQNLD